MLYGPLRLRVVADQIIEQGGATLAVINEKISPTMLATFIDFLETASQFGPTDEIMVELDGEADESAYTVALREVRAYSMAGAVPLALVEKVLSDALGQDDKTLTPVKLDEGTPEGDEETAPIDTPEIAAAPVAPIEPPAHKAAEPNPVSEPDDINAWGAKIAAEAASDNKEAEVHGKDEHASGDPGGGFEWVEIPDEAP